MELHSHAAVVVTGLVKHFLNAISLLRWINIFERTIMNTFFKYVALKE